MPELSAFHALQARTLAAFKRVDVLTAQAATARRHLLAVAAIGVGAAVVVPSIPTMLADRAAAAEFAVQSAEVSLSVLKLEQAVGNIYESAPQTPYLSDLEEANAAVRAIRGEITDAIDHNQPAAAALMANRVAALAASELGARATLYGVEFSLAVPVAAMRSDQDPRVAAALFKLQSLPPAPAAPPVQRRLRG
jgi:hypothetical protein